MAEHRAAAYMFAVAMVLGVLAAIPAGIPDFSQLSGKRATQVGQLTLTHLLRVLFAKLDL
jgi:uncharacterized membrane protein